MAWNYSGDPSASDLDWVRYRIGDTDTNRQLITDEEINAMLAESSSKQSALLLVAKGLLAKWMRAVDSKMGKLTLALSQRIKALQELIDELEEEAAVMGGGLGRPWMAAHRIDRRQTIQEDTNRLKPAFAVGMHDIERQSARETGDTENDERVQ